MRLEKGRSIQKGCKENIKKNKTVGEQTSKHLKMMHRENRLGARQKKRDDKAIISKSGQSEMK